VLAPLLLNDKMDSANCFLHLLIDNQLANILISWAHLLADYGQVLGPLPGKLASISGTGVPAVKNPRW